MTAQGRSGPTRPSVYVQAVPIFLASDTQVARYFTDCRDEIDAISGIHITILVAEEIRAKNAAGVAAALNAGATGRFPGLGFGDLPCLWIEDEFKRAAIVRLPHKFHEISQLLRTLSDICRQTKDAPKIKEMVSERLMTDTVARSPHVAALLGEFPMNKSSERLIALIFGVIFVSAILGIALFIPSPTAFQYTVFRIVLALAAAGFVSMTPGFIEAKVGTFLRAGGALAVFAVVYFYAPAALSAL